MTIGTHLGRQIGEFTVLNELTQVRKTTLLCLWNLTDEDEDGVDNCLLVIKSSFLSQDIAQEIHPVNR